MTDSVTKLKKYRALTWGLVGLAILAVFYVLFVGPTPLQAVGLAGILALGAVIAILVITLVERSKAQRD